MSGLTHQEVESLRARFGYNEVKTNQTPEWKKILWRYLDWVSIIILAAAIISATVEVEGGRGWTSFVLLILELNLIVWVGYYSERNAGDAVKELEVIILSPGFLSLFASVGLVALVQIPNTEIRLEASLTVGDENQRPAPLWQCLNVYWTIAKHRNLARALQSKELETELEASSCLERFLAW
jgi:hypothetical protein